MAYQIGIIGDFNGRNPTHVATTNAIQHAAEALGEPIQPVWLATDRPHEYGAFQGLLGSPGSPYRSLEGALAGIRYARGEAKMFLSLGNLAGASNTLVIEYARNVMGFQDAAHAESDPDASCLFITPLSCSLVGKTMEVAIQAWQQRRCRVSSHAIDGAVLLQFRVESGIPGSTGETWTADRRVGPERRSANR